MLGRVFLNWPQTPIDLCLQQNCESIKCKKGCFNPSLTLQFLTSRLPSEGTQWETALRHLLFTGAWRLLITETPWVLCSLFHSITLSGTRQQITRPSIRTRTSHLAIPDASRVLRSLFHLSHAMKSENKSLILHCSLVPQRKKPQMLRFLFTNPTRTLESNNGSFVLYFSLAIFNSRYSTATWPLSLPFK